MDFDTFFNAIAQQESGGNYGAINGSSGALGKYQIMPANVPAWSQKYLGVKWSANEFLGDPRKQDALARAVLQDYYDQYGPRGAAAAWYSGRAYMANDYTPQSNGPSIGSYVDSVMARTMSPVPGGQQEIPTTIIDKTVKSSLPPQTGPELQYNMGELYAPGTQAVEADGAEAVQVQDELPQTQRAQQADALGVEGPIAPEIGPQAGYRLKGGQSVVAGRAMAVEAADRWLGTPYVYGGGSAKGPSRSASAHGNPNQVGFDCSGLVQWLLAQAGINAPRLSYDQLKMGRRTSVNNLQPGDLVGWGDGHHVAMYLGNGRIVEAPRTGLSVRTRTLSDGEDVFGVSLDHLYY